MAKTVLTLAEIAQMDCVTLTPEEVSKILGCNPNSIRIMARTEEGRQGLGFPVVRVGTVTKVLRIPFLRHMGWSGEIKGATS